MSRRSLMAAGVRETVAREYRRLLAVGVSAEWAVVLARGAPPPPVEPWTAVAADLLRSISAKGHCVRWHGPGCGCWERWNPQPVDGPVDNRCGCAERPAQCHDQTPGVPR